MEGSIIVVNPEDVVKKVKTPLPSGLLNRPHPPPSHALLGGVDFFW